MVRKREGTYNPEEPSRSLLNKFYSFFSKGAKKIPNMPLQEEFLKKSPQVQE